MKSYEDILDRLELILSDEYSCAYFSLWIGFNCDFEIDELENGCDIFDAARIIYNKQVV